MEEPIPTGMANAAPETPAGTSVFEYEAMVERYSTALFQTLRHHQAPGDLDTWVPDADPLRGILNVVEAAEIAGRAGIAIRVGSATLAGLDVDELAAQLAELGRVDITRSAPLVSSTSRNGIHMVITCVFRSTSGSGPS